MPVTSKFKFYARDHLHDRIEAEGYSNGSIVVRNRDRGMAMELPAELVRQIRGELENQALDRIAAYARERGNDALVYRDNSRDHNYRRTMERVAEAYREMAAYALGQRES